MDRKHRTERILFVMHLPPPFHGVSVMNEIICKSTLINEAASCDYIDLSTANSIRDLQRNRISKYFGVAKIIVKVLLKLIARKYDTVYITPFPYGTAFLKDSLVIFMAKLWRKRTVLHLHTFGFKAASERSALIKKYYRFIFGNTEVICLSETLKQDIAGIFHGRIHTLPNGIPQVNFANNYSKRSGPLKILYLSNLIKGKGVLLAVEATRLLKEKGVPFTLRIAGPEGDVTYEYIGNLTKRYGLENEIVMLGPLYGADKYAEFTKADVFILPSNYDTFGLVLLEAMQFGVPCIASNMGAMPELLGQNRGLILTELSAEELANAFVYMAENPEERMRMSKLGFAYYEERYRSVYFEKDLLKILLNIPASTI